ncbi:hypothetical protein [Kushneria phosphatilytica]|uniref:Uncharacterized protein n=1 Tax=Kushneria phosphatilytica TaxID=657387 RepID=A0A1S1NTD6_9GAMM|nr:hypothetical protein [Kushneria phosphatilytica]OHV12824.1 hypothetical protein BH688_01955 [Kushneria phosphatilytica]QEL10673.1 hypothetical protein FY550_05720 [Kushneria phosphatilytica]
MLKDAFSIGPFTIRPVGCIKQGQQLDIEYGHDTVASGLIVSRGTRTHIIEQISDRLTDVVTNLRDALECHPMELIDRQEQVLAGFSSDRELSQALGETPLSAEADFYLCSADRRYALAVSLDEYARLRARHELPANAWIAALLPEEVTTPVYSDWRPPTGWELLHVAGEGSLTATGWQRASELTGIPAERLKRHAARVEATTQCPLGYAEWHLLLHRLAVQQLSVEAQAGSARG